MGFTVVHDGTATDELYREYDVLLSRLLLKRGVSLDRVPLAPEGANGKHPLYVWDTEADAQAFADQLRERTEDAAWRVRPVNGPPSLGPLRPLRVEVSRRVESWVFGLDPLTCKALQLRFPGSCRRSSVTIHWDYPDHRPPTDREALRTVALQLLPLLTELSPADLHVFGSYQVVDPVNEEVLVGPTPLQPWPPSEPVGVSGGSAAAVG
jgi:hypothetical protein